jgi:CDP-glucose 4,6-dehydratase
MNSCINPGIWQGKTVLVTGHTGFKGTWLISWLNILGANIIGFSLEPNHARNMFSSTNAEKCGINYYADLSNYESLKKICIEHQPEVVFHLAAQSLVLHSYSDPKGTYQTNVMGTLNLLEAVKETRSVRAVIIVTSDKCYKNNEWMWGYRENEAMGGEDPYSSSKGCAELLVHSYRTSFFSKQDISVAQPVGIASVRSGNVIGGGDWAQDRLIPDLVRSYLDNKEFFLRKPDAVRPWQHVLEPLSGYILLAQLLMIDARKYSQAWNFGPDSSDAKSVGWVVEMFCKLWGGRLPVKYGNDLLHEAGYLRLDSTKAREIIGWTPVWNIDSALRETVKWYKQCSERKSLNLITYNQIESYMNAMTSSE